MNRSYPRVLLPLASFVVVVAGLKAGAALLLPFMLALFLTMLSLPLFGWLKSRLPGWLAVTLAVFANLMLVVGLGALVSGSVTAFVAAAPRYQTRLADVVKGLDGWLVSRGMPTSEFLAVENFDPGALLDLVVGTLRGVASAVTYLVLVILTMIFMLLEISRLPAKLEAAVDDPEEKLRRWGAASEQVQRYLVIKTAVSIVTGVLIGLGMWLVGLDFPLLWGLVAFLFNYIPNLGSILAAFPACLMALAQLGGGPMLLVGLIFLVVNVVLGNIIEPQLHGRRLGLSPLVVFLSLVFWGWVWGPVGMLLSVPLTVIVRIVLESSEELGWVAALLAARPRPRAAPP